MRVSQHTTRQQENVMCMHVPTTIRVNILFRKHDEVIEYNFIKLLPRERYIIKYHNKKIK